MYSEQYMTPKTELNSTECENKFTTTRQKIKITVADKHKHINTRINFEEETRDKEDILNVNKEHQSYLEKFFGYMCPASIKYEAEAYICHKNQKKNEITKLKYTINKVIELSTIDNATVSPIEQISFFIENEKEDIYILEEI